MHRWDTRGEGSSTMRGHVSAGQTPAGTEAAVQAAAVMLCHNADQGAAEERHLHRPSQVFDAGSGGRKCTQGGPHRAALGRSGGSSLEQQMINDTNERIPMAERHKRAYILLRHVAHHTSFPCALMMPPTGRSQVMNPAEIKTIWQPRISKTPVPRNPQNPLISSVSISMTASTSASSISGCSIQVVSSTCSTKRQALMRDCNMSNAVKTSGCSARTVFLAHLELIPQVLLLLGSDAPRLAQRSCLPLRWRCSCLPPICKPKKKKNGLSSWNSRSKYVEFDV